jgi:MFS family permease
VGEVIGGTFGPVVAGNLADRFGLQAPMYMAIVCAVAATLLATGLRETAPVKVGARALAAPA